jgi:hypothetical protein
MAPQGYAGLNIPGRSGWDRAMPLPLVPVPLPVIAVCNHIHRVLLCGRCTTCDLGRLCCNSSQVSGGVHLMVKRLTPIQLIPIMFSPLLFLTQLSASLGRCPSPRTLELRSESS